MRNFIFWAVALVALPAIGAERIFDFSEYPVNQTPPGFTNTVAGEGKPGEWKIILDEVTPLLAPLTAKAPTVTKRAVLAQLSRDTTDEHFPMLIFTEDDYADFTLTTRFKTAVGATEQMAGIAFRIQDEKNYYVVRASALGNSFRFYKMVNGVRGALIGPEMEIPKGVWHEMSVECKGNQIRCSLNGKEVIPMLTDNSFGKGKIGFWTKSDSVSYFTDTKVTYTPLEIQAQKLVRDALKDFPKLLGLKIYAVTAGSPDPRIVASSDETELGAAGSDSEKDVIARGRTYYGKGKESVTVVIPVRDRNGDPIAAAKVIMRTFTGQTEENAVVRAMPVVKSMQRRVQTLEELVTK